MLRVKRGRGAERSHFIWEIRSLTVRLRCGPAIFLPIMLKSAEPFPTEGRGQAAINMLPQSPGLGAHSSFGFRTGDILRWPLPGVALQRPLILLITLGCTLYNHPCPGPSGRQTADNDLGKCRSPCPLCDPRPSVAFFREHRRAHKQAGHSAQF